MTAQFNTFIPPVRTLMGPGPSDVDPRILNALSRPTLGHLDPAFIQLMDEVGSSCIVPGNPKKPKGRLRLGSRIRSLSVQPSLQWSGSITLFHLWFANALSW